MTLLQHHLLALCLTTIFSLLLGLFVWLKNPGRWLNRLFALHSFTIAGWAITESLATILSKTEETAMFWVRIEHMFVFFLPPLIFHLVAALVNQKDKPTRRIIQTGYSISLLLTFVGYSPLIYAKQVQRNYLPYWIEPGPLYWVVPLFFWTYVGASLLYLRRALRETAGRKHLQLKYFLIASLIGYLGGGTDFMLVYDLYIPWLHPYALYLVAVYKLATAYIIFNHHFINSHSPGKLP